MSRRRRYRSSWFDEASGYHYMPPFLRESLINHPGTTDEKKAPKKKAVKEDPLPKGQEICPMCERPAIIHKRYAKKTYNVHEQSITVREPLYECDRCGEKWASTADPGDGLSKAYTIYMKRRDPQARKFRRITFEGGSAYVKICEECMNEYGLKDNVVKHIKKAAHCNGKGCRNNAIFLASLGRIYGR